MIKIFRLSLLMICLYSFHSVDCLERKLAFVRHGTTDWNWRDFAGGMKDLPVNKLGEEHAKEASESLFNSGFTLPKAIVSSPLLRCKQTAKIIQGYYLNKLGIRIPVLIQPEVQGPIYGKWTQETYQNVGELVKEVESLGLDEFASKNLLVEKLRDVLPGDEESEEKFLLRICKAVDSIMNQYDEVIVVSHGSSSEAYLKSLNMFDNIHPDYWKSKNRFPLIITEELEVKSVFAIFREAP
ncbi:histidine phosphatase family protein [Candidatus Neptunichlamydia sp. REUL1]|uniref:histidine phosphatase family protein n=1 Tax=Candidatus Neptunichlamydia sp. REUL1 TaxID=3064277 RepID=UPI00292CFF56|nr:histidine phosphatase family protein [Candidatus Neptunochlamydia sp. REUL1]